MKLKTVTAALVLLAFATAEAKVVSGTPFADNMVLQRGRAVPVWGVADSGESVTVSFAGQTKTTKAGDDGKWSVALDPMDASAENRVMKIAGAGDQFDCNDKPVDPLDGGYGCMQIHNAKSGATVFAYNHFNGGNADIGIGSCPAGNNPDWTFAGNAGQYKARRLTVLVK